MNTLLARLGFKNFSFFVPIDPDIAIGMHTNNPGISKSIASHVSSNLKLIGAMKKHDYFIILEDDVIPYDYSEVLNNMQSSLNDAIDANFDLLNFEPCWQDCGNNIKISKNLTKSYNSLCSSFIVYSKKGANKIIDNFNNLNNYRLFPFDCYIQDLTMDGTLDVYQDVLFKQNSEIFGGDLEGSYSYNKNVTNKICATYSKMGYLYETRVYIYVICITLAILYIYFSK